MDTHVMTQQEEFPVFIPVEVLEDNLNAAKTPKLKRASVQSSVIEAVLNAFTSTSGYHLSHFLKLNMQIIQATCHCLWTNGYFCKL